MSDNPNASGTLLSRRQITLIIYVIILIVVATVLYQNWERADVRVLLIRMTMPRPILDLALLALGFVLGLLAPWFWKRRKRRSEA